MLSKREEKLKRDAFIKWIIQTHERKNNEKVKETASFIHRIELISEEIENSLLEIDEYEKSIEGKKNKRDENELIFSELVSCLI